MWLCLTSSFLVLLVICVETNNVTDGSVYKLEFWTRDPKYEKRQPSVKFRSGQVMRPIAVKNVELNGNKPNRRIRQTLKERIQESVRRTQKKRGHENNEHVESTRVYPKQLVEKRSTQRPSNKKLSSSEEKNKPLEEDKKDNSGSEERLSPYEIQKTMNNYAQEISKHTNVTVEVIGRTFEFNDIILVKMSEIKSDVSKYFRANDEDKYIDEAPEKKIIFIVHALVTMGVQNCLGYNLFFRGLLKFYVEQLDKFDIFLIPMANPDGFAASFNRKNWNKNTSPQSSCIGVNLDRNFDVAWSEAGQVSPCSQYYPGPNAFSEPESRAVRDIFHKYGHKIAAYIHVHGGSFLTTTYKGDAVLYPKGFTDSSSDDDKFMDLKGEIDEAMRNISFQRTVVTVDTLHHWYGKVTGTSVDYASTVFGIPFAMEFVMETYERHMQTFALITIWKKVIEVVFNFIHKKNEASNDV